MFCKDSLLDLLATGGLLGGVVGFLLSHKVVQFKSVQFIRSVGAYETKCGGKSVGSVSGKRYKSYVRNALKKFSFCGGAEGWQSCLLWNARILVNPPPPRRNRRAPHRAQQRQPWLLLLLWKERGKLRGYAWKSGGKVRVAAVFRFHQLFSIADVVPIFCFAMTVWLWSVIACRSVACSASVRVASAIVSALWCIGRWLHPNDASRR